MEKNNKLIKNEKFDREMAWRTQILGLVAGALLSKFPWLAENGLDEPVLTAMLGFFFAWVYDQAMVKLKTGKWSWESQDR